jgi:hypothetical protein
MVLFSDREVMIQSPVLLLSILPRVMLDGIVNELLLLPPSEKRCNYGMRVSQTDSSLTKFIANSINIYVSK